MGMHVEVFGLTGPSGYSGQYPFFVIRELFWYILLPHGGGRRRYWAILGCCSFGVTFDRSCRYIDV